MKSCVPGFGIALLPTMLIEADLRAGRLLRVLPGYRRGGADFNILA
jgi:DNA-binding transcriptional LysR family regulator